MWTLVVNLLQHLVSLKENEGNKLYTKCFEILSNLVEIGTINLLFSYQNSPLLVSQRDHNLRFPMIDHLRKERKNINNMWQPNNPFVKKMRSKRCVWKQSFFFTLMKFIVRFSFKGAPKITSIISHHKTFFHIMKLLFK